MLNVAVLWGAPVARRALTPMPDALRPNIPLGAGPARHPESLPEVAEGKERLRRRGPKRNHGPAR